MDRLKKARTPKRATFTKSVNEIKTELKKDKPNWVNLKANIKYLESIYNKIEALDDQIQEELLNENATEAEMTQEADSVAAFTKEWFNISQLVHEVVDADTHSQAQSTVLSEAGSQVGNKKSIKLPKIELPKFNGDLKNWLSWWSQFEKIDSDGTLYDSVKFQYLIQATEVGSEPREMITVFPPTAENYAEAIKSLKRRYGREGLQLQVYLREILNLVISNVTNKEKIPLEKLYLKLASYLGALKTLDLSKSEPSMYFYPLVESSLPEEVLRTWLRNKTVDSVDGNDKKNKLEDLMEFIKKEVEGEQQIHLAQNAFQDNKQKGQSTTRMTNRNKRDDIPTSQSLVAGSSNSNSKSCVFCDKNHNSSECRRAIDMTIEEKKKKIQEKRACFNCFIRNHRSRDCKTKQKCIRCKGTHHALMCEKNDKEKNPVTTTKQENEKVIEETVSNASSSNGDGLVLMKTVCVDLVNSSGKRLRVRLLFDDGSNRSFIKTATAEKLNCKILEEFNLQTTVFGGKKTGIKPKKKFAVTLQSLDKKFQGDFKFISEDVICGECPVVPPGPWISELASQNIVLTDSTKQSSEIEILVGGNLWGNFMTGRMFKMKNGLTAMESVFGWTLSGEIASRNNTYSQAATAISMFIQAEKSLPEMWDLESIGIKDPAEKLTQEEHDEIIKEDFKRKIQRATDGRYVVELPWISRTIPLPTNKSICEKRLHTTTRKLTQEGLLQTYSGIFRDWEAEGIIEKVDKYEDDDGHYLPHHRVLKDSKTTPVRPVFDASCKMGNKPSLNDCLERGPNLLELIPSILLRFREKDVGVIADIRKAFQMIGVADKDKKFQKFLWWEEGNPEKIMVYKHSRVVFGLNCSPFMLAAVLEFHLEKSINEENKTTVELLNTSNYVDNVVLSLNNKEDYRKFRELAVRIFADAKMDLRQWESNCETSEDDLTTVLGLLWDKPTDTLNCKFKLEKDGEIIINKRNVLSAVSKIFDPIGFTCPATLQVKLLLQSSWSKQIPWDEEWEGEEKSKFLTWLHQVDQLEKIKIPRVAVGSYIQSIQLHLFTDASQDAYAAVIYARVIKDNQVKVQLLLSKSRLAPLTKEKKSKKSPEKVKNKRITIPRLELMGCCIGARLLRSVQDALSYHGIAVYCWSDSTTALTWIKREENWGTFVGNRVREINELTDKTNWRHIPGESNPADLPSRGCNPTELRQSRWWEGPDWMYEDESKWPKSIEEPNEERVAEEIKKSSANANVNLEIKEPRYSSYWKNVRVAAWKRRFIHNTRVRVDERIKSEHLTKEEITRGEVDVLLEIQQQHFPEGEKDKRINMKKMDDGLFHIETRLDNKQDVSLFKNPIVLPSKDPLVLQLIEATHKSNCHAGTQFVLNTLREKYWILQGRATVNKVIRKCVTCRRFAAKNLPFEPAPLPKLRVDETQCSFQTTGVDLAGPIQLKGGKKAWVVIYTCAVYRGVFLDIVDSISSEEFLNSLHKFTCLVGRPTTTYSDNGTNFVGAQSMMSKLNWNKISKELAVQRIAWRFNPPTAAWWGGWWERLIRSLKDLLRRMIGQPSSQEKNWNHVWPRYQE